MVASCSSAASTAAEFMQSLKDAGKTLLEPYATVDELLNRLDNLDLLLRLVNQDPSPAMEEALKPSKDALVSDELLRNDDLNVKVSVVCCICEFTRITAPVEPYGDDKMREIFQLLIMIFGKLSSMTGRSYSKALSILDNFAKCQLCMLMWDCDDAFIVEMFQLFLQTIHSTARVNHPPSAISEMERIMTLIIKDDEEDIPVEVFSILLDTLRRENENACPLSYSMAERVFSNCAVKLKHRLSTAVKLTDISLDDYAEIVARVCNDTKELAPDDDGGTEGIGEVGPSNSLMNSDAGFLRNDDSSKNRISMETLQCLEIEKQKVSIAETNSHCQNSDAIRALQGFESEAFRTPGTNEESLKDESSLRQLNACDQIKQQNLSDATRCSQTEDPDPPKTVQEELNAKAVSAVKINEDTSGLLNACDQTEQQNISDATLCSQSEDHDAAKTVQEELNAEAVSAVKKNEDTSRLLNACDQIEQQKISDATRCSQTQDPDAEKTVQEELNAEVVSALKINEDTSRLLNARDQIKLRSISDATRSSQTEDPDAAKTVQEELNAEAVSVLKTNEGTSILLNACDQINQQNVSNATHCSQTEDLDAAKTVQEELNAEAISAKKNEDTWKDENPLASLQCCDQIKLQKNSDARTNAGPVNSDAATLVQQKLDPGAVSIPKKRGRKPNTLIKPEEGYDLSWILGERKSPYVPRRRRNYRKEIGGPSKSSVSKNSSLPLEPERDSQPRSALETPSQSFRNKKRLRKGNPRNEDNILNEDADLLLLSDSARDLMRTSSDEKTSPCGAVTALKKLETKHTKWRTHTVVATMSDGGSRNPERGEGSSVKVVAGKQRRDEVTTEHIQEKSRLKTLPSLSTPKTLSQEFDEAIKAKRKRKHTSLKEEVSELTLAVKDNGEKLVGCQIQVYWPLDKMFYKGSVTSFDILTKKHKVTYDDGDEETLDLTEERWELVGDDIASDNLRGQMSVTAAAAALHNESNNHAVNSSRPPTKKHKDIDTVSNEHVLTSDGQRLKVVRSKSKLEQGQAKDPVTPAPLNVKFPRPKLQDRTHSKSLQLMKGKKLVTEPTKDSPLFSIRVGNGSSKTVDIHGYFVKSSSAPILEAIVAKYGDIAANCLYKSPSVRASLLEVVCSVIQRLKNSGVTASDINAMINEISDAADAKLEVSWLQQYLIEIVKEEQAAKRSSEERRNICLIMKAAKKDIEQRRAELVAAQEQLRKAESCVEVLKQVSEKIDNNILESLAKEKSLGERLDALLYLA